MSEQKEAAAPLTPTDLARLEALWCGDREGAAELREVFRLAGVGLEVETKFWDMVLYVRAPEQIEVTCAAPVPAWTREAPTEAGAWWHISQEDIDEHAANGWPPPQPRIAQVMEGASDLHAYWPGGNPSGCPLGEVPWGWWRRAEVPGAPQEGEGSDVD